MSAVQVTPVTQLLLDMDTYNITVKLGINVNVLIQCLAEVTITQLYMVTSMMAMKVSLTEFTIVVLFILNKVNIHKLPTKVNIHKLAMVTFPLIIMVDKLAMVTFLQIIKGHTGKAFKKYIYVNNVELIHS